MTAKQYRAAIDHLGLTQAAAAKLLHASPRTSRRWAKQGVVGLPAVVLLLLLAGKVSIDDIRKIKP